MEFVTNNEEFADSLKELINSLGFNSKIVARKIITLFISKRVNKYQIC